MVQRDTMQRAGLKGLVGGDARMRRARGAVRAWDDPRVLDVWAPDGAGRRALTQWLESGSDGAEVEIGFGRGRFLSAWAAAHPRRHFVGFEVRTRWCRELLGRLDAASLDNVRIAQCDARPVLAELVPPSSLAAVHAHFPDPWWKRRHHKRRLFAPAFVAVLHRVLRPGGAVWFRTDVPEWAEAACTVFEASGRFAVERIDPRALPPTHRQLRCERVGLPVAAYRFVALEPTALEDPHP